MTFELHHDGGDLLAVRLVTQDGPGASYTVVPLGSFCGGGESPGVTSLAGAGACELGAFTKAAGGAALSNVGEWCTVCGNTKMDACAAAAAARGAGGAAGGGAAWRLALAVVCSVAGTAAVAAAVCALLLRRGRTRWAAEAGASDGKGSGGSGGGDSGGFGAAGLETKLSGHGSGGL